MIETEQVSSGKKHPIKRPSFSLHMCYNTTLIDTSYPAYPMPNIPIHDEATEGGEMDFQEFKKLNLSEIEKWKHMKLSSDDIIQWKKEGSLVEHVYELKMRKLYLEYLKIKIQNMMAQFDPFENYNPIAEAELILKKFSS